MSRKFKPFLLLSTVLLWTTWASASAAIIQSKGCNATTCTFNSPTASGHSILVAGATAGNGSNFTPTDNFSNPYVQDDRAGANFGANGTWLTLYRASTITSGTTTVSTTSTGAVRTLTILVLRPLDYVTKLVSGLLACELPLDGNPVAIHTTIPGPSLLAQASDVSDSAFA